MKKLVLITAALGICSGLRAQTPDTAKMYSVKEVFEQIDAKRSQDDKQNFAKKLTALGSFVSSGDNTINLKPTLYGIGTAFNRSHKTDEYYRDHAFQRNFEIDLGITPGSSIFKYSSTAIGFTYAIINNAAMSLNDYVGLIHARDEATINYHKLLNVLAGLRHNHPDWHADIDALLESEKPDKVKIAPELDNALKASGFKNGGKIFADADKKFDDLLAKAKTRPLLTLAPGLNYDGARGWIKDISVRGNFTFYKLFATAPNRVAWSITPSYKASTDTVAKNDKLSRKIVSTDFGPDIKINPDKDGKADWEIKPVLNYTHTVGACMLERRLMRGVLLQR